MSEKFIEQNLELPEIAAQVLSDQMIKDLAEPLPEKKVDRMVGFTDENGNVTYLHFHNRAEERRYLRSIKPKHGGVHQDDKAKKKARHVANTSRKVNGRRK